MKKLTISKLKTSIFNPTNIIEEMVSFDSNDIREMQREVDEALIEVQLLKEAIFYKIEKTRKKIREDQEEEQIQLYRGLEETLDDIEFNPLDDFSEILDKRREIIELKKIKRILKYSIELENNEEQVLESLFTSDSPENWELLAEIIYAYLSFGDEQDSDTFLKFSKRIEEKMIREFQESLSKGDLAACRRIFEVLKTLDKEMALIDQFLLNRNLLSSSLHVHPPILSTIDLDKKHINNDSFEAFIDETTRVLEENKHQIFRVFGSESKYNEYFFSRIYKTLIAMNLESFCNVANPGIFLLCITRAYMKVKELSEFITLTFSRFEYNAYIDEIFNQYIYKAVLKEAQLFDEVLNVFVLGARSVSNFLVMGEVVAKNEDMVRVFERMLVLINSMMERRTMFYSQDDEKEILKYFGKRLCVVVDKVIAGDLDKMSVISKLKYIYLLHRRFFNTKLVFVNELSTKLAESISQSFEDKIEHDKAFFKGEISNLFFTEKNGHRSLFDYLKHCLDSAKILQGKNHIMFAKRTLDLVYNLLYKQIQIISFDEQKASNFKDCINDLIGYVFLTFENSIENRFETLKFIFTLIVIDQGNFLEAYKKASYRISEKELKEVIRCRDDKDKIRALIFK